MSEEFLETGNEMIGGSKETSAYQKYLELGGIINENDYESALSRIENIESVSKAQISQVSGMLDFAGIQQKKEEDTNTLIDLYSVLRDDIRPEGANYHHDQMSDQQILVEALRMLGDSESVDKMIKAYPNISFVYKQGDNE